MGGEKTEKEERNTFCHHIFCIYNHGNISNGKGFSTNSNYILLGNDQYDDETIVVKEIGNRVLVKAISYHNILSGSDIPEGTLILNVLLIIDLETDEANFSGSFLITATNLGTIRGRVKAKIIDFSGDYQTEGTFQGGGYMSINGTLSTPYIPGWTGPLVWDGVSW